MSVVKKYVLLYNVEFVVGSFVVCITSRYDEMSIDSFNVLFNSNSHVSSIRNM